MEPVWLVEAYVYGGEIKPLLAEVRRQGMDVAIVPHPALRAGSMPIVNGRALGAGSRVIGYGSFPFARQIQLHQPWTPGAWCDPANLDCAIYVARLGRHALNRDCQILNARDAVARRDELFARYGRDDEVFARPSGCVKLFVGRRIHRDDFRDALSAATYDLTAGVLVAAPRLIGREWRLVVAGDRLVAASQYAVGGARLVDAGCPGEVRAFAESVLTDVRWRPDPIFMLDVCEAEGRLWVVELNGFSCSWIYACDVAAVVSAAGELARGA